MALPCVLASWLRSRQGREAEPGGQAGHAGEQVGLQPGLATCQLVIVKGRQLLELIRFAGYRLPLICSSTLHVPSLGPWPSAASGPCTLQPSARTPAKWEAPRRFAKHLSSSAAFAAALPVTTSCKRPSFIAHASAAATLHVRFLRASPPLPHPGLASRCVVVQPTLPRSPAALPPLLVTALCASTSARRRPSRTARPRTPPRRWATACGPRWSRTRWRRRTSELMAGTVCIKGG